ncbi:hypothetical protein [Alteromonas ponticola]|uniref:Uncharacterized protein n=1 Tax=Alteromonas ponticola TaxID=2720613 RepID=A0ABX1R2K6_9ALTE|nr:hypothetical protein [Alteromonas ponticola]NMH59302.1 hypothetical protein [Alteromonas ponticola]
MMHKLLKTSLIVMGLAFTHMSHAADNALSQPETVNCPGSFFTVDLPTDAKQCQLFDTDTPASMVFFSPANKDTMIQHFQSTIPSLKVMSTFNDYTLLMGEEDTIRIIVSTDGKGSQVDVLIIQHGEFAKNS